MKGYRNREKLGSNRIQLPQQNKNGVKKTSLVFRISSKNITHKETQVTSKMSHLIHFKYIQRAPYDNIPHRGTKKCIMKLVLYSQVSNHESAIKRNTSE